MFIALRVSGISANFINLFQQPMSVMSTLVLFLSLLIYSSYYYDYSGRNIHSYMQRQFLMVFFLIVYLYFGYTYSLDGLKNTSIVFLVLYLIEKYSDFHFVVEWRPEIFMFFISVFLYKAAMWLHNNREFVISLFDYDLTL